MLLAAGLTPGLARAQPACLPLSLFPQKEDDLVPALDLGLVANVPTLCARRRDESAGLLGCWTIDAKTGALSVSTATNLPGQSQRGKTDPSGCIEGYCTAPKAAADELLLWAVSTDGAHAVILREQALHVFDGKAKTQTGVIPLSDSAAPDTSNVSNMPVRILYVADTIYVVGSDAGPFIGVWPFRQDGKRMGFVTEKQSEQAYSVYLGTANVLDDTRVALANAGLRSMLVLSPGAGQRQEITRNVGRAPCTKQEMENVGFGDLDRLSAGCRKTVAARFEPYFDLAPIRLPSGHFLAALSGKGRGSLAILDGRTLTERQRLKLRRCTR